jgi:hypothetical protein
VGNRRSGAKQRHFCLEGAIKTIIGTKTDLVFLHMKLLLIINSSFVIYYCLYISYYEGVDGVYRESCFTQVGLPSVAKTTKIYREA